MTAYELTRNWMSINMTDEEFIERLRHCIEEGMCYTCQYFHGEAFECNINRMLVSAYDLIIKQNAEIKRFYNNISAMAITMRNSAKETRNEAIREFWDILKAQNTMDERIISVKSGDDLLKEMVGEK